MPRLDVQSGEATASVASPVDDIDDFYDIPPAAPGGAGSSEARAGSHQLAFPQASFSLPGLNAAHGGSRQLDCTVVVIDPDSAQTEDTSKHVAAPISTSLTVKIEQEHATGGLQPVGAGSFKADTPLAEIGTRNENAGRQIGKTTHVNNYDEVSSAMDASLQEAGLPELLGGSRNCTSEYSVAVAITANKVMEYTDTIKSEPKEAPSRKSVPPVMVVEQSEHSPQKGAVTLPLPDSNTKVPIMSDMDRDVSEEGSPGGVPLPIDETGHQQLFTASSGLVANNQASCTQITDTQQDASDINGKEAEYELDSSPFESSSDDSPSSSSDSSSDNGYEMLDPAEQARRLMQEDGGSDEDGGKRGAANGSLRTLNEKPDEVVEKPDINITEQMLTEELGDVENFVDNLVLIKAKTTGEYQVLETGSLLCLKDRTVIGVVAETLGRVQQPLYTVRFTSTAAISDAGISKDTRIYYVPQHSTYVFTQALKAIKGSDASNIHDEEVGDDELEFSDDEAEAEFKRNQKLQRQARRGGRGVSTNGFSRDRRQNISHHPNRDDDIDRNNGDTASINYDDDAGPGEELYTPFRRPTNLHEQMPEGELSSGSRHGNNNRGSRGSRIRYGPNRARGDRGRGDRGRGRDRIDRIGGTNDHHSYSTPATAPNLSLPPTPPAPRPPYPIAPPQHPLPSPSFPVPQQDSSYEQQQLHDHSSYGYQYFSPGQRQYPYQPSEQAAYHAPQLPAFSNFQAPYQQHAQQIHYHTASPQPIGQSPTAYVIPPIPPGSFVNPAFFGNNYQHSPQHQNFPAQYGVYPPPQQNGYTNGRR